jgi:hypothetical protein
MRMGTDLTVHANGQGRKVGLSAAWPVAHTPKKKTGQFGRDDNGAVASERGGKEIKEAEYPKTQVQKTNLGTRATLSG